MANRETVSDQIASRIRELRWQRGEMTVADLAAKCDAAGMPSLTTQALYRLEQRGNPGRPARPVSVDELLVLAYVLDVAPMVLLAGNSDDKATPVTPKISVPALVARNWITGFQILPGTDEEKYVRSLPVGYQAGYMTDFDQALAANDAIRENLLQRKALNDRMRALAEEAMSSESEEEGES
jgi:hypothetical protein